MFPKRQLFIFSLLSFPIVSTFSQKLDYGVVLIYNSSSQTNYDPTIPEDGTFQWNSLGTWGAGAYVLKGLSPKFASSLSVLYQQKGYRELAQVVYFPGDPIKYEDLRNTFDYLSADLAINYRITNSQTLSTFISLGVEYSYLLSYEIESDFYPINSFYPVNAYQDKWETHNISVIPSISITFYQSTTFEFGFNRSLIPVLETDNLIVKDWIWTFRLSQSVPALFKKDG
jgi:hypothetical protein